MSITRLLTPDTLQMLRSIEQQGSFANAARDLGLVPSALTYRVRQIEDSLDVLLFDRSARKAVLTEAGRELVQHGSRILEDLEAVAHRVKRVATGWESQIDIAIDCIIAKPVVLELVDAFFALKAPTRLRLRDESLSGTWHALTAGRADLAIGVVAGSRIAGVATAALGVVPFVFAAAPHHALCTAYRQGKGRPLTDLQITAHRIVAVADSTDIKSTASFGILNGQDVLTVATMQDKLDAQLRGLGCGNLPEYLARPHIEAGRLIALPTEHQSGGPRVQYAWRESGQDKKKSNQRALRWWIAQLALTNTQQALLGANRLGSVTSQPQQ
jgi:DNA-binding transcriptional LysR family regulator